jgi:CrcB protein
VTPLWLALAGAGGAVARYGVDGAIRGRWPSHRPWATLVVNVSGSLLLGVITGLVLYRDQTETLRLVVGTGFCGGFTTFSTTSFETVRLAQTRSRRAGAGYLAATAALTLGAAALGLAVCA